MSLTAPRQIYDPERIRKAVEYTADRIVARMGDEHPIIALALLNGALWFAADLLRLLPPNYILETARVSSYGDAQQSSGKLRWLTPPPDCRGKRVLLLDDVLDTGLTLHRVRQTLLEGGAHEVLTAVAVEKDIPREHCPHADFAALHTGDRYLIGYGMDARGKYRNLPDICEL